jgi:NAD(P)-dependent dehydrogenase (short-subunit alcohol dehydrogenase family)
LAVKRSTHGPRVTDKIAVFLASKRAANVTGANYVIDGGLLKTT